MNINELYRNLCVLLFPSFFVGFICLAWTLGILVNDVNWHKQEVYDSWNMQGTERAGLIFDKQELGHKINDLNLELEICKTELVYTKIVCELEKKGELEETKK